MIIKFYWSNNWKIDWILYFFLTQSNWRWLWIDCIGVCVTQESIQIQSWSTRRWFFFYFFIRFFIKFKKKMIIGSWTRCILQSTKLHRSNLRSFRPIAARRHRQACWGQAIRFGWSDVWWVSRAALWWKICPIFLC